MSIFEPEPQVDGQNAQHFTDRGWVGVFRGGNDEDFRVPSFSNQWAHLASATDVGVPPRWSPRDLSRWRVHPRITDATDLVRTGGGNGRRIFPDFVSDLILADGELGVVRNSLLFPLPLLHARGRWAVERRCDNRASHRKPH